MSAPSRSPLFLVAFFAVALFAVAGCNSPYTPRKKGFFKIDFPEKKYVLFDQPGYPYIFEYPEYARIVKDSTFFDAKAGDWWINIDIPSLNGTIYISYKPVTRQNFDSLINDGYKMAYRKHTEISTGIDDSLMVTPNNVEGIYFSLKGNTATSNQFFVTDSSRHFLRGALYFDATPNEDSLSVVNEFLKQDLKHLINTLRWRN